MYEADFPPAPYGGNATYARPFRRPRQPLFSRSITQFKEGIVLAATSPHEHWSGKGGKSQTCEITINNSGEIFMGGRLFDGPEGMLDLSAHPLEDPQEQGDREHNDVGLAAVYLQVPSASSQVEIVAGVTLDAFSAGIRISPGPPVRAAVTARLGIARLDQGDLYSDPADLWHATFDPESVNPDERWGWQGVEPPFASHLLELSGTAAPGTNIAIVVYVDLDIRRIYDPAKPPESQIWIGNGRQQPIARITEIYVQGYVVRGYERRGGPAIPPF
jgi:hypothetical protein